MIFGLIGGGALAKELLPFIFDFCHHASIGKDSIFIVLEEQYLESSSIKQFPQRQIISLQSFIEMNDSQKYFVIAISDPAARGRISTELEGPNFIPAAISGTNVLVYEDSMLDCGSILLPNSVISSSTTVGAFFQLGFGSYLAHDCLIGDFVTIGPGVTICGNVEIRDFVQIGAGVTIKPGTMDKKLIINEGTLVGSGSVVISGTLASSVVAGNPARQIK